MNELVENTLSSRLQLYAAYLVHTIYNGDRPEEGKRNTCCWRAFLPANDIANQWNDNLLEPCRAAPWKNSYTVSKPTIRVAPRRDVFSTCLKESRAMLPCIRSSIHSRTTLISGPCLAVSLRRSCAFCIISIFQHSRRQIHQRAQPTWPTSISRSEQSCSRTSRKQYASTSYRLSSTPISDTCCSTLDYAFS